MCSRYSLTSPHESVRAVFGAANVEPFPPRPDIRPTEPALIVRQDLRRTGVEAALVRWGFIPPWVKDVKAISTLINARAETAAEKPSFRGAMRHKRCLVPADGFYEWAGPPRARQRYLIRRRDGALMGFAGLWSHWLGADGSEIETMAILTVAANGDVATVHDRMPAILEADRFEAWLDCAGGESGGAATLLRPAPDGLLDIVLVAKDLSPIASRGDGDPGWGEASGPPRLLL